MGKIFKGKFLSEWVKNNLDQLTKEEIFSIYKDLGKEKPLSRLTKPQLLKKITKDRISLIYIYNKFKKIHFGMRVFDLEASLNIDKKIRLKMQQKDFLKIAYYEAFELYKKTLYAPVFDVEHLSKLTEEKLQKFMEENFKKPTEKQLADREKRRLSKTCKICGTYHTKKEDITNGLCKKCYEIEMAHVGAVHIFKDAFRYANRYVIVNSEVLFIEDNALVKVIVMNFNRKILLDVCLNLNKKQYLNLRRFNISNESVATIQNNNSVLNDFILKFNHSIRGKTALIPSSSLFFPFEKFIFQNNETEVKFLNKLYKQYTKDVSIIIDNTPFDNVYFDSDELFDYPHKCSEYCLNLIKNLGENCDES